MDKRKKLRYVSITCILIIMCCGFIFPDGAPHISITNAGVHYDIYFAGSTFRDAIMYDPDSTSIINIFNQAITGYCEISGVNRTANFPTYDYGNIRINDTYPSQYIYLNNVTSCEFIGFSEAAFWKHDLTQYLLVILTGIVFLTYIKR